MRSKRVAHVPVVIHEGHGKPPFSFVSYFLTISSKGRLIASSAICCFRAYSNTVCSLLRGLGMDGRGRSKRKWIALPRMHAISLKAPSSRSHLTKFDSVPSLKPFKKQDWSVAKAHLEVNISDGYFDFHDPFKARSLYIFHWASLVHSHKKHFSWRAIFFAELQAVRKQLMNTCGGKICLCWFRWALVFSQPPPAYSLLKLFLVSGYKTAVNQFFGDRTFLSWVKRILAGFLNFSGCS